ncbi:hypothetical protein [Stenotrophomonas maltophilia]|uniref:hypothetical protein n=1 Tax=Stenotrophomonas maltophilia TaxID=40324 RepID=UPI00201D0B01|nr:hypothetical protein [Stenotrophomonas maltophilia]UQY97308.1 hypothetical protein LZ605_08095 [Stenotrophomonas maltophilia]
MSLDLKLNAAHDLAVDGTNVVLVDGASRVRQQIKVTLMTWFGEYFLDVTFGVPYLESILVKRPNRSEIEAVLRQRINDVPGVTGVTSMQLNIDRERRQLEVSFQANTDEGLIADTITLE